MKRGQKWLMIALLAVGILLVGAMAGLAIYNNANHAIFMNDHQVQAYNQAITNQARANGTIAKDEFVLIDDVSKDAGGHTNVSVRVYKAQDSAQEGDFLHLRYSQLAEDAPLLYMANGTARLLNDSLDQIVITVKYVR